MYGKERKTIWKEGEREGIEKGKTLRRKDVGKTSNRTTDAAQGDEC
jgi:hypothetical protein